MPLSAAYSHTPSKPVERKPQHKPYACPVAGCTMKFAYQSALKRHNLTHTKERAFMCNHPGCTERFNHPESLKIHKNIHTGEKPYVCTQCNKRFGHPSTLHCHRLNIHVKLVYSCRHCGNSWKSRNGFRAHLVREHGVDSKAISAHEIAAKHAIVRKGAVAPAPPSPHPVVKNSSPYERRGSEEAHDDMSLSVATSSYSLSPATWSPVVNP